MGRQASLVPSAGFAPGWRRVPTLTPVTSTSEHLQPRVGRRSRGPRLTFYDDATGERVELSTTTLANWVAKTMNLLVLECGVGPGSSVSLHLPRHWTTAVWTLAADAVGAEVYCRPPSPAATGAPLDVAVVGPDDSTTRRDADEVFAVSLAPTRRALCRIRCLLWSATTPSRSGRCRTRSAAPSARQDPSARWRRSARRLRVLSPADRVAALGALQGLASLVERVARTARGGRQRAVGAEPRPRAVRPTMGDRTGDGRLRHAPARSSSARADSAPELISPYPALRPLHSEGPDDPPRASRRRLPTHSRSSEATPHAQVARRSS